MISSETLGSRVRALMGARNMRQRGLMSASGLSANVVNDLYNGKLGEKVSWRTLERVAEALQVDLCALMAPEGKGIYQDLRFNQFTSPLGSCYSAATDHLPAPPHIAHARAQAA